MLTADPLRSVPKSGGGDLFLVVNVGPCCSTCRSQGRLAQVAKLNTNRILTVSQILYPYGGQYEVDCLLDVAPYRRSLT
jgi:hypothetical protein